LSIKKKLNSFQVIKFTSHRLKRTGFKVERTLQEALTNGEVVKLGENELLYTIQRLLRKSPDFDKVDALEAEKKRISKLKNSSTNRERVAEINNELEELTFVPHLVAIQFSDKRHYINILDNGLFINNQKYVRIMAGAGNIRRSTVFFVEESLYIPLMLVLNNGRNEEKHLNPAKFSAYLGLYGSAGHRVHTPSMAVIKDYFFEKKDVPLTWVDNRDKIDTVGKDIFLNVFDGQGLISPRLSNMWAQEMGLDYTPSTFIFRAPFAKGQVVTFDFHSLAEYEDVEYGLDIWGNKFSIKNVDLVLSESQFKLWDSYDNLGVWLEAMKERMLGFRITRYSPEHLRNDTSSNYMFNQVLELDYKNIENLTKHTLKYFSDIQREDPTITSLYLSGATAFPQDMTVNDFKNLDTLTQGILLYPELLKEKYVSQRLQLSLDKKKQQAKLGKLFFEGNYSPLVSSPYAHGLWLCGKEPKGLLAEDEHYCAYWSDKGITKVASARSPLTHNSEMRESLLVDNVRLRLWYKYLDTVFILPLTGLDTVYYADSDFDGDLVFSTSQPEFMKCRVDSNPISYEHGKAENVLLTDENISEGDMNGFNSKIGFITNVSSTLHTMKYDYPPLSVETGEINRRLVLLRLFQGEEIDGAKNGGVKRNVPEWWTKYDQDSSDMDKDLVANRRPYFTRYLYDTYDRRYRTERDKYNKHAWSHFGKSFQDILDSQDRTDDEQQSVDNYYKYSFFLFSPSPMNRISWYMENRISDIHKDVQAFTKNFDYTTLFSYVSFSPDNEKLHMMKKLFIKYNSAKKAMRGLNHMSPVKKDIYYIVSEIGNEAREKITSNAEELGNLAISLIIADSRSRAFVWTVFGTEVISNIRYRYGGDITVLVQDPTGEHEFMFNKFSQRRLSI